MNRIFATFAATLALTVLLVSPDAFASGPLKTEDYFRAPKFLNLAYSHDGKLLAALAPSKQGRMNLFVLDLSKKTGAMITDFRDYDVVGFSWINDHRLVFSLGSLNEVSGSTAQNGGGLFAVNADGSNFRKLADIVADAEHQEKRFRPFFFLRASPDTSSEDVFAVGYDRSSLSSDVYKINTFTNRRTLMTFQNPGRVTQWVLDHKGNPRVAVAEDDDLRRTVYYRETADGPWHEISSGGVNGSHLYPLAFDENNKNLIVSSDHESDTAQIYRYDPDAKVFLEKIYGRNDIDIGISDGESEPGDLILDPDDHHLLGIRYQADRPGVEWIDQRWRAVQKTVDAALPKTFNIIESTGRKSDVILIKSYSDRVATTWFSFSPSKRTIEEVLGSRPWFDETNTVEMRPVTYRSRDGLMISSYLFLPAGADPKNLPLIVNVHGGPWVDSYRWGLGQYGAGESQLFAAHGYAVLLANYRGTRGFGRHFYEASYHAWGKGMQDDLEDGVNWLASKGTIDPKRVCIYGASYGGYAALEGLVHSPDFYQCGVGALAVTDLVLMVNSAQTDIAHAEEAGNATGTKYWKFMVGDPKVDADAMRAVSPALNAARIKANVLLISGGDDSRVPLEQGQEMKDALEKNGKKTDWLIMSGEYHGFGLLENNVKQYDAMLKFFDENLKAPAH